ncbi:MAG: radical SAM protein [Endomicrobia bacterium]|nr:radical SAM protein [Endomicrobiia bacterium]
MTKVILINPPIYDFSAYDVWLKPLGLLYLSNILKNYNIEVILLDCLDRNYFKSIPTKTDGTGKYPYEIVPKPEVLKNIPLKYKRYGISQRTIEELLVYNKDASFVIVTSSMTYWYLGVKEIIETTKKILPKAKIILGGIYPILLPKHSEKLFSDKVDLISKNFSFCEILKYLNLLEGETKYKSFSNFPPPDYTLYKYIWYVVIRFSYGCLNNCKYCASKSIFAGYEMKSTNQIINEITYLYNLTNCENFVLYDDALLNAKNLHYITELFNKLIRLNLKIKFYTPNGISPRFITKDIAYLMKQLNFTDPRLSLETISSFTHKLVDNKVNLKDFEKALENLTAAEYKTNEISVYLLAGLPNETIEDVYKSINLLHKYKVRIRLNEFSLVPRSKIFYELGLSEEDIDPLLYNNSIFLFNGIPNKVKPWCKFEELQYLKNYVKNLNEKILNLENTYV